MRTAFTRTQADRPGNSRATIARAVAFAPAGWRDQLYAALTGLGYAAREAEQAGFTEWKPKPRAS